MAENHSDKLRWREVYSLGALSAAVAISWIAYHEYQPKLLADFGFGDLVALLIIAKGIILVVIPPLAGKLSDIILKRNGKLFMVFSVGIGATSMVFMIVASIIGAGPLDFIRPILPLMIILWLISMNIFISPALSMIDSFAPTKKLPLVVGFLVLITELVYALEPVVVELVLWFGDTYTFIIGGLLILVTGYFFNKTSSDEVMTRRTDMLTKESKQASFSDYFSIIGIGFILGIGNAFLVEFVPIKLDLLNADSGMLGDYMSFILLGLSAFIAFGISRFVSRMGFQKVLPFAIIGLIISLVILIFSPNITFLVFAGILVATGFSFVNVSGLPFAISKLSIKHITYGVGIYIGSSNIAQGILEYLYM